MKLVNVEKDLEKDIKMGGAICDMRMTHVELTYGDFKDLTERSPEQIKSYLIRLMGRFTINCRMNNEDNK